MITRQLKVDYKIRINTIIMTLNAELQMSRIYIFTANYIIRKIKVIKKMKL